MAGGRPDLDFVAGLDLTQANAKATEFARKIESRPIKVRFDASGLGQISGKASEFERSLSSATSRVIAFGASASQVYILARAFENLVRSTIDVQKELADINSVLGLSSRQLTTFSADLFKVANQTGQTFKIAASSALEFSRQGLSVTETLKRTKDALTLTRLSGLDVIESTKAITAALNSFNDVALDSTALINKLGSVDAAFSVSSGDLAQALQRVGNTAQDTGVSFDSLIGLVTAAQQTTQRGGAIIGNALKSIFQRIQRPEVLDNLRELGILTEDVNGKTLAADQILQNTAKKYGDLSAAQKEVVVQLSSGLFQANQFRAILQDLGKESSIYERALATSAGATDQAARRQAELNKTLASELNKSLNNLQEFASKAGNVAIAPALKNLFKISDFATTNEFGKSLGDGILRGLGDYLSGPGLALGGALILKLFTSFASQATKSFAQILEVGAGRAQNERVISDLLASEAGSYQKILAAGNDEVKVQQVVLDILTRQNVQLNERVAATSRVATITGGSFAGVATSNKGIYIRGGQVRPNFSALSDAIDREKKMGVNPAAIRVGTSGQLVSAYNPLGIGIYNTKDEPLGINQGIQRAIKSGNDPKKAGTNIPNFADNPFPFLPNRFSQSSFNPNTPPPFDIRSLVPDLVRFGSPPPPQNFPLLLGNGFGKNAIQLPDRRPLDIPPEQKQLLLGAGTGKNAINLPELTDSSIKLNHELYLINKNFKDLISSAPKLLRAPSILLGGPGGNGPFGPDKGPFDVSRFNNNFGQLGGYLRGSKTFGNDFNVPGSAAYASLKAKELSQFESGINGLNLLNAPFNYFGLKKQSEVLNQQGTFREAGKNLRSQALISSFVLPLIGGVAQSGLESAIGTDTTGKRGAVASVGALTNIASFAATGAGIGGVYGAAAGLGLGLLVELPKAIKAFSDTLPDLQKRLEDISERSQKTSAAFAEFSTTAQQIFEVTHNNARATKGQLSILQSQNISALNKLPSGVRGQLLKAAGENNFGGVGGISEISDIYNSQNQLSQNFNADAVNVKKFLNDSANDKRHPIRDTIGTSLVFGPYGGAGSDVLDSINRSGLQANSYAKSQQLRPLVQSLLGAAPISGANAGKSLLELLSSGDLSSLGASKAGGIGTQLNTFKNILGKKGFTPDQINDFISPLKDIAKQAGVELSDVFSKIFSRKFIDQFIDSGKQASDAGIKYISALTTVNQELIRLTQETESAVNDFDIKILKRLSKSITDINVNAINRQGSARSQLLQAGGGEYLKNFLDYKEERRGALDTLRTNRGNLSGNFQSESAGIIGSSITNLLSDFNKSAINNPLNKRDANAINQDFASGFGQIGNVLSGIAQFTTNTDGTKGISLTNLDSLSPDRVKEISSQLSVKANDIERLTATQPLIEGVSALLGKSGKNIKNIGDITLDPNKKDEASVKSGLDNVKISNPELYKKLLSGNKEQIDSLLLDRGAAKSLIENTRKSIDALNKLIYKYNTDFVNTTLQIEKATSESTAKFNSNAQFLSDQFRTSQIVFGKTSAISRGNIATQGILQRSQTGANPFEASRIQLNQGYQNDITGIRSGLAGKVPGIDFSNIDRVGLQNLINNKTASLPGLVGDELNTQKGYLEALVTAANELDEKDKDRLENLKQITETLRLQLAFSDAQASALRSTNVGRAAQGETFSGKDYTRAFAAPLQYNSKDFQRDTIGAAQDFGQELKNDLGDSLLSITRNAKDASEAFTDLGLALAGSLAKKGIDIGLNSLFGAGIKGLSSLSPGIASYFNTPKKASGGYIAKFASGGFVNMGSGTKDDVPAFLSGGEFVINKNAVNRIGVNNLDLINGSANSALYNNKLANPNSFEAVQSDSVNITGNSADVRLQNSYLLNYGGINGKFATSPLLSRLGQIDENNPQNKIKFSRERYGFAKRLAYLQHLQDVDAFETQQWIQLGQAYLGAAGSLLGAVGKGGSSGVKGSYDNTNSINTYDRINNTGGTLVSAHGGPIPRFASGGHFGGDSGGDRFRAMIMGGEYVMSPKTVSKYGNGFFKSLNNTAKYADGGSAGTLYSGSQNDGVTQIVTSLNQIRDRIAPAQSSGGDLNNTNHVNINITMASDGSKSKESQQSANSSDSKDKSTQSTDKDSWDKVSNKIKGMVINELTQQSRPGGILYQNFKKKVQ